MNNISESLLSFAESELIQKESIRRTVLSSQPEKQKKPVAWTKILLPVAACLMLICGTVLLIPSARAEVFSWFESIFSDVSEQIGKDREEQSEQFQSIRENLSGLPMELAGELEVWMDFREDIARARQNMLREAAKNAVPIGQEEENRTLAEFSVYDVPGIESVSARHLFFAFSAPSGAAYDDSAAVYVDGIEKTAFRMEVPFPDSDTQYAIYECIPELDTACLPDTSLIAIRVCNTSFCFRFRWTDRTAVLPTDREQVEWLEQNDRLAEATRSMSCVCVTEPITNDGITVTITDLTLDGNNLIVDADVEASPDLSGMHAQVFENKLRVRNKTYSIGVTLFVSRLLPDDFDFTASLKHHTRWSIYLPIPASELAGEIIDYSFYIHAVNQTDQKTEDNELRTQAFRFEFRFTA